MTAQGKRRRDILAATMFTLAGLVVLIGLGLWQLERKAWKEGLLLALTSRLSAPVDRLPVREHWALLDRGRDEFRRVTVPAEFITGQDALVYAFASVLRPDVSGSGYWLLTPARLVGGSVVVVNRGFVPAGLIGKGATLPDAPSGIVELIGAMRWPDERGMFTPDDDPKKNTWYLRDPKLIADAKGWGDVAPFYIELEAPQSAGGVPRSGPLVVKLVNNHLQYALTWFGLAAALAGVYFVWLWGRRRS